MTKINISYLKIKPLSKITCRVYDKPLKTCIKAYRAGCPRKIDTERNLSVSTTYLSKWAKKLAHAFSDLS